MPSRQWEKYDLCEPEDLSASGLGLHCRVKAALKLLETNERYVTASAVVPAGTLVMIFGDHFCTEQHELH